MNSYRITLHPEGMAPRIVNFAEWAHDMLGTLDRQVAATRDPRLRDLLSEVTSYPNVAALGTVVAHPQRDADGRRAAPACRVGDLMQSWFSTNTSIGTPVDITLEELHVELFHPADEATAAIVGGRTA